jgi:hypothetical protein
MFRFLPGHEGVFILIGDNRIIYEFEEEFWPCFIEYSRLRLS